jgi:esterase/lipase
VIVAALMIVVLLGPRAHVEERWIEPDLGDDVEAYLATSEAAVSGLKEGEAKAIVWNDPESHERTPLSVVYIHGFSADRHEIAPLPRLVGEALGANVYYARLTGHGRDGEAMAEATAEDWLDDAAEAMTVGRAIGDRVLLLGTSTGATLAVWAAAQEEAKEDLAALVLLSPNFGPNTAAAQLLLWPWGNVLSRLVLGPERCFEAVSDAQEQHWTTCYPSRALLPMMALVERARTLDFGLVTAPMLMMYSPEDLVVEPGATVATFRHFSSVPKALVSTAASPRGGYHVLAGDILSPETTANVTGVVLDFVTQALEQGR